MTVAEPARLGRLPELLERRDAELLVDEPHRLRPEAGDPQQLDEGGRDLGAEPVVEAPTGRSSTSSAILSLIAWPTPAIRGGVPRRYAGATSIGLRAMRVGGPVVGDGLEHELALDLEHVADLVEDPGEIAVGQGRDVVLPADHRPRISGIAVRARAQAGTVRRSPSPGTTPAGHRAGAGLGSGRDRPARGRC